MRRANVCSSIGTSEQRPANELDTSAKRPPTRGQETPYRMRFFGCDMVGALHDASEQRGIRLLTLSNERFSEAACCGMSSERTRVAAFESAYLAIASVAPASATSSFLHPSIPFLTRALHPLPLSADDRFLVMQMAALFATPGWHLLDYEAVLEWCQRVRFAVARVS